MDTRNARLLVFAGLLVTALADGLVHQIFAPRTFFSAVDLPIALVVTVLIFTWYRIDSDRRRYERRVLFNIGVIFLPIVFLPCYLFRTRGFVRGSLAVVAFMGCVVAYGLLQLIGVSAAYKQGYWATTVKILETQTVAGRASYKIPPHPVYPPEMIAKHKGGKVLVAAVITAEGIAENVTIKQSSGERSLDEAALQAVRDSVFNPAESKGVATSQLAIVPIDFNIESAVDGN